MRLGFLAGHVVNEGHVKLLTGFNYSRIQQIAVAVFNHAVQFVTEMFDIDKAGHSGCQTSCEVVQDHSLGFILTFFNGFLRKIFRHISQKPDDNLTAFGLSL